ncbi:MAG: hypothetical protein NWQ54_06190 [Paraglaciecola sp.]|uniref:hypothetical protein n=1 Tax=Pseudomonadati TaxID=3379134 RepID=UPI00273DDEA1|nr:hypothetical protein [Paraglaciecola sp.]MDP5030133.1 hypothetical protein [Paraglaciecola sp.]MDP5130454.1 hypothetical protein [Paraglaciecola sp.]
MKILILLFSLLFISFSEARSPQLVVVVNKNNAIEALSKREVIDIFMGRYLTFPDGETAQPVDLPAATALKSDFYLQLVNRDEQKINAYWARLLFSGRAKPPEAATSIEDALNKIQNSQYSIAYLPEDQLTDDVKVVYRLNEN